MDTNSSTDNNNSTTNMKNDNGSSLSVPSSSPATTATLISTSSSTTPILQTSIDELSPARVCYSVVSIPPGINTISLPPGLIEKLTAATDNGNGGENLNINVPLRQHIQTLNLNEFLQAPQQNNGNRNYMLNGNGSNSTNAILLKTLTSENKATMIPVTSAPTSFTIPYYQEPRNSDFLDLERMDTITLRRLILRKYHERKERARLLLLDRSQDLDESIKNQITQKIMNDLNNIPALRKAFFDFVLHVPIYIDGQTVPRRAWAKAFYEMDVIQSAKCLFGALFSPLEMSRCTLNGKKDTEQLNPCKMLAIMRASVWMKRKRQDPYSFDPGNLLHNLFPSKDERDKIEKKVFTERRSQANRKTTSEAKKNSAKITDNLPNSPQDTNSSREGDSDSPHSEMSLSSSINNNGNNYENNDASVPKISSSEIESKLGEVEFGDLEKLFYRFPDEFLEKFLPDRTDIYIDGLLITHDKWEKAFEEASKDTVKAAWTLFQYLFSDEEIKCCTLNGKNRTVELCPIRKLAIIRAVQWMSETSMRSYTPATILSFDSDEENCNTFPSAEEKERIETKVFTEKRYQHSRHLKFESQN